MSQRPVVAALAVLAIGTLTACASPASPDVSATTPPATTSIGTTAPTSASPTPATTTTTPPPTVSASTCGQRLLATLTLEQKVGQLLMVGAHAGTAAAGLDPVLRDQRVGGVVLLGTWNGASTVSAATRHWQPVGSTASGGIGVLVAADQEGGQVRHLRGAGFTATPSALSQGRAGTAGATAATVAAELTAVGVNVDLAPVADTVAASFAPRNAPIGAYQREYGNDPATVTKAVVAAVGGYQDGGISATLKHFPGLGRVTGNTDVTADGTTDPTTTVDDPYLEPFRAGIQAGADLVMVSSALYPKSTPPTARRSPGRSSPACSAKGSATPASSSPTTSAGQAAVAGTPAAERATRFVAAGGDIVLTGLAQTVPTMARALRDKATAEPAFAAQVDAAATRVLDLKVKRGLAAC